MQQKFFRASSSGDDRLSLKAAELRERAKQLSASHEREALLREADQLDQAARADAYLRSTELKPPT